MYSNIVPFSEIIESVKDDTGITNLRNLYPQIRRYIYRIEKDIGFGSSLILKRIKYSVAAQNILVQNGKYSLRLPEDIHSLEEVGMCSAGICPGDYTIQGNYLFFCRPVQSISLIYYSLLSDGEGNPVVSLNHAEAVVSGISYMMYRKKRFQDKGNLNTYKMMEMYYEDRVGEARGDDVIPTTQSEWRELSAIMNMSSRDIMMYSKEKQCFCCVPEVENENSLNMSSDVQVYFWQFADLSSSIDFVESIDQEYLDLQRNQNLQVFLNGYIVEYSNIGKIAFALKNVEPNSYRIYDVFNTDITDVVFNKFYNEQLNIEFFVSKTHYTHSNIFFKIKSI